MTQENDKPIEAALSFKLSEDQTQLIAVVHAAVPDGTPIAPLDASQLRQLIIESGHTNWQLLDDELAKVCSLLGKSDFPTEIMIGKHLDGKFAIKVAENASCVHLSVTPAIGGKPVTTEQVAKALADSNIIHGIKTDVIQKALSNNAAGKYVIAESTPPTHGENARFESLIAEAKDTHPLINEDGRVDYHEIGSFISVNAGDALMRKIPATQGINGVDVYGRAIIANPGKDIPFSNKLHGVEIDPEDQNLLRASTGGLPKVLANGVSVSTVIDVKDVNLSTGNIDFNGTVNIRGDVIEGMKVNATGDVIIAGMTEGAHIHADGNIIIHKGVIGRGELRTEAGEPGQSVAILTSGGSIEARFIENAIVHAAGNITIGEFVSHSELFSHNTIVVGKKGAKKGHILGGSTRARISVDAHMLGSQSNVKTHIDVGNDPELHEKVKITTTSYEEKIEEQEKLLTLIHRLKQQPDQKSKAIMARALSTLKKLNEELKIITTEKTQIEAQDQLTSSAIVYVRKHAFPETSITIGNASYTVQNRTEAGSFVLEGQKVCFKLGRF